MMFADRGDPLTQNALDSLSTDLNVPLPALWAVLSVETSGCGFLPDRRPQILFERHKFREYSHGKFDATHPDLSNKVSGGYGAYGAPQYLRLGRAIALDRTAALKSTSWGLGQVMGFNATSVGFPDVEAMVNACVKSEEGQMRAMCGFIKSNNLTKKLRDKDWAGFARAYNGSDFQRNKYDEKLAKANARYEVGPLPDLNVRWAQLMLTYLNFPSGGVDGWFGVNTQNALLAFQRAHGLPLSGQPDKTTTDKLAAEVALLP